MITTDPTTRKNMPLASGVLDYFPDALLEVARVSRIGNDQHNPGQPLHWAKEKSTDEADALVRHLLERGKFDSDGGRHSAKVAWRALALLQREIEGERLTQRPVATDRSAPYRPAISGWCNICGREHPPYHAVSATCFTDIDQRRDDSR